MKGVMYDLNMLKAVLKKIRLAPRYVMIKYRDDWPVPRPRFPNQVQVKSRMTGICTSDLHQINVNLPYSASILARRENPFPIGHEVVGEITEVGDEIDYFDIGDRVVHSPIASCEAYGFNLCTSCKNNSHETCYTLVGVGDGTALEERYGGRGNFGGFSGGGFSEFFLGFEKQFTRVPSSLHDRVAVLAEPFAVALHAVARNPPKNDDVVIVIGAGIIGLLTIAAIRSLGYRSKIISLARYGFQGQFAKSLGANVVIIERKRDSLYSRVAEETGGLLFKPKLGRRILYGNSGPDMVYDTVGKDETLDDALHLVRSNGRIVIIGMDYGVTKKTEWALQVYKEIDIIGSIMHGVETIEGEQISTMELALRFLERGSDQFMGLVTHEFRIEDYKDAFDAAVEKGQYQMVKSVFNFEGYGFEEMEQVGYY